MVQIRYVYLRVTVDGIPKELSTKMKWDFRRWDQEGQWAIKKMPGLLTFISKR
jgi:hypothetical protein